MDLNRLKTFLKVAQYGSFKQVATKISLPASSF